MVYLEGQGDLVIRFILNRIRFTIVYYMDDKAF